jgi:hypothetical protein
LRHPREAGRKSFDCTAIDQRASSWLRLMPRRAAASPIDSTPIPRLAPGKLAVAEVVGGCDEPELGGSMNGSR